MHAIDQYLAPVVMIGNENQDDRMAGLRGSAGNNRANNPPLPFLVDDFFFAKCSANC